MLSPWRILEWRLKRHGSPRGGMTKWTPGETESDEEDVSNIIRDPSLWTVLPVQDQQALKRFVL